MTPAEVAQRSLIGPDGAVEPAWVVTSEDLSQMTIFSGVNAAERATTYARANYAPLKFRLSAEPGKYFERGKNLGEGAH